ncbi:MAG TPA: hypothetical protein VF941_00760 [Clostridia bacterium]
MGFVKYVREHGSDYVKKIAERKDFPKFISWDKLKLFVNSNEISDGCIIELENLYDDYMLDIGAIRRICYKVISNAG